MYPTGTTRHDEQAARTSDTVRHRSYVALLDNRRNYGVEVIFTFQIIIYRRRRRLRFTFDRYDRISE